MKFKVLIIILCFVSLTRAQNNEGATKIDTLNNQYQIEYTVNFNNYIPLSKKGILIPYLKENKSNYYEMPFDEDNATKDDPDDSEINETIVVGKKMS
ncbi:hypothetical protein [Olleya namhaensis]|uniref:hypothetical protein n=1 Tax=Olleya namhaensis TaxID=1144750 RepID=UPI00248F6C1C|nr:hypothetical protein [Olleya namhaensis]